jgi:hypothetical protein
MVPPAAISHFGWMKEETRPTTSIETTVMMPPGPSTSPDKVAV